MADLIYRYRKANEKRSQEQQARQNPEAPPIMRSDKNLVFSDNNNLKKRQKIKAVLDW